ncbi:energy transducer TonB [Aurantiacibacter sp. MUD11]|uniref:TonB C-terminal domain-containing protein n=1 Tax=Aurantiacibacter sp. MUD11 TaxID=3003265 RepID=UPI0022AA3F06|nr:TonB C-terminal domain-containing protein [Aurantiacibacter sp. MUD11]WAT17685.1 energy transducer TonB [Aurantiacibacter sp. MUD11]
MAYFANLTREERIGVGAAIVAHVALAGALAWQATREPPALAPPERMDVSLASEVSLESTAPDPSAEPAASTAPELAEVPEAPQEMVEAPAEQPVERPVAAPPRRTSERSTPAPTPTQSARPTPTPTPTQTAAVRQEPRGGRLDENFLEGASDASGDRGSPAETVGPAEQAAIGQAIIRQLRPHWQPPSGIDVDQLVTVVRFRLNRDGSLAAAPEVLRTTGQNDANRAQVRRHQEQAVRAVRLAAPFNLPEQFYSGWRVVTSNFDNRLAQ